MKFISRRTVLLASALAVAVSPTFAASVFSGIDTKLAGRSLLN